MVWRIRAWLVAAGDDVVPVINGLLKGAKWDLVVYTQDYHPKGHASFASSHRGAKVLETRTLAGIGEQVMWPDHCVQGSLGAEFHPYLTTRGAFPTAIVRKGQSPRADSYSGAFRVGPCRGDAGLTGCMRYAGEVRVCVSVYVNLLLCL